MRSINLRVVGFDSKDGAEENERKRQSGLIWIRIIMDGQNMG